MSKETEKNTQSAQQGKKRSLWRWALYALVGGYALYIGLDVFQGKMLGALVGTTVDPRSALGERSRSLSMERRLFVLNDTVAGRKYKTKKGIEIPEIKLGIPKAYINSVRSEKDGWFGTNIHSFYLAISSENFKPYRLEYGRVHREVLDKLGIKLVKRSVRYPRRKNALFKLHQPNRLTFPSDEEKARYDAEMLRRGFTKIATGIGTGADVTDKKRNRDMLGLHFRKARRLKKFEELEGCVISPGPFLNSVRYDHSPESLASVRKGIDRFKTSCISARGQRSFVIVQYDDADKMIMLVECRYHGKRLCEAYNHWRKIWSAKLSVSNKYLHRIPEFIEKRKTLFDSFFEAAKEQS